jgi:ERO1-like protein alpha
MLHSMEGTCLEERVFHRLISGMQASVNSHIAMRYVYGADAYTEGTVAPNVALWVERVGRHPERIQNLYFGYLFTLRAVARAGKVRRCIS